MEYDGLAYDGLPIYNYQGVEVKWCPRCSAWTEPQGDFCRKCQNTYKIEIRDKYEEAQKIDLWTPPPAPPAGREKWRKNLAQQMKGNQ